MKNDPRSTFLAPFRADRATAESDIIVHMAVDDLRQFATAAAHRMSVYSVSAFLAETLFLVKTPPKAPRFSSGLPSYHVGHLRDFGAQRPRGCRKKAFRAAYARKIELFTCCPSAASNWLDGICTGMASI